MVRNLAVTTTGATVLVAATKTEASEPEWAELMSAIEKALGRGTGEVRVLIFTDGAIPTAEQRRQISDLTSGRDLRIIVFTKAIAPRFAVASLALFIKSISVRLPKELHDSYVELGFSTDERRAIDAGLLELKGKLQVEAVTSAISAK